MLIAHEYTKGKGNDGSPKTYSTLSARVFGAVIYHQTSLKGACVLEPEQIADERGFFARTWCREEFQSHGLDTDLAQCSLSFNHSKGTLRGMHFQVPPHTETKLVRCTQGAIFDVILDLRAQSSTYMKWMGIELSAENRKMLYIPQGFAHGFQTLADNSEAFYLISAPFNPEAAQGVRWNDSAFQIRWPETENRVISGKDQHWPLFDSEQKPWFRQEY